ncbi:hypothetical protein FQA39_LY11003 [Lamprigera yunnana]|nr:hypothetical protein FQA39_LY11003 [Lamprigera yunnana]
MPPCMNRVHRGSFFRKITFSTTFPSSLFPVKVIFSELRCQEEQDNFFSGLTQYFAEQTTRSDQDYPPDSNKESIPGCTFTVNELKIPSQPGPTPSEDSEIAVLGSEDYTEETGTDTISLKINEFKTNHLMMIINASRDRKNKVSELMLLGLSSPMQNFRLLCFDINVFN